MYSKLNNHVNIKVLDRFGYLIEEVSYRNIPMAELYPDEDVVLIEWVGQDNRRPTMDELADPIEYEGQKYYGNMAWG